MGLESEDMPLRTRDVFYRPTRHSHSTGIKVFPSKSSQPSDAITPIGQLPSIRNLQNIKSATWMGSRQLGICLEGFLVLNNTFSDPITPPDADQKGKTQRKTAV